jgi:uncharacterized protein YjiS (DUF1127 family)
MPRPKWVPVPGFLELEAAMPAITALAISATAPLGRALLAIGARAGQRLKQLAKHIRNRRDASRLAALDDRMLADVGLNRSDLRDAFAELPWRDPSEVLARRAAERRSGRRLVAPPMQCYPPLNRSARYLM